MTPWSPTPDVDHRIEVLVPDLPAGRLQSLFIENVQPEFTQAIVR